MADIDIKVKKTVLGFLTAKGEIPGKTEKEQLRYEYLDEGLIDSMGIVEMVLEFEKKFDIRFKPQHLQSAAFRTVGGLILMIENMIEDKNHA